MGVKSWVTDLIGGAGADIISSVGDTVDKFVTTDAEKRELDLKMQELQLKFKALEQDAEMRYLEDKNSARAMYQKDSSLQKTFAIIFLVGYLVMSGLMVWLVIGWLSQAGLDLPAWAVSLISAVFTAMSSKVNTIVDFLFGGSQGQAEEAKINRTFHQGARTAQGQQGTNDH